MALTDSAGLLFRIRADGSQAKRELNDIEGEVSSFGDKAGSALKGIAAGGAIAGAALLSVAAVAAQAATTLFSLSQNAALFGSEIFNASVKTGLTTETISALKLASERTGVSMESLGTIISRFSRLVGEAEQGSDKAAETLKRLGITPKEAIDNLDGALGKVFLRIQQLPDPIARATLAQQAFGKAGTELLKVIDDFNGDLPGAIEKARELGLVMSKEDAAAADEFGDAMDTLRAQLRGVGFTIGKEFMPEFQRMVDAFGDFLSSNKDNVKTWARGLHETFRGIIEIIRDVTKATKEYSVQLEFLANLDPLARSAVTAIQAIREKGRAAIASDPIRAEVRVGGLLADNSLTDFDAQEDAAKEAEKQRKEAARKAAQLAERDLTAQIRIETNILKDLNEAMVDVYEEQRKKLGEGKTSIAGFLKTVNENTDTWQASARKQLDFIDELEKRALKSDATEHERALLHQQQLERRQALEKKGEDERLKNANTLFERRKAIWEKELERAGQEADHAQFLYEMEQKRLEARRELLGLDVVPALGEPPALSPDDPGNESGIGALGELLQGLFEDADEPIQLYTGLVDILTESFQALGQAVGASVKAFVLFGGAGTSFRKFAAELLASIAQMAAIQAVWNLAEGFAKLALAYFGHPTAGASATQHFIAAAVYGTIAGVAALAGRAVAGDEFKRQAAGGNAPGRQTGANTQSSQPREGGAYSSQEDQTIEMGVNQPTIQGALTIKFEADEDSILRVVQKNVQANGGWRSLIVETANGA